MDIGEQVTWTLEVYKNGSLITEYTDSHTFTNTPSSEYILAGKFITNNTMTCGNYNIADRKNVYLNNYDYTTFVNNGYILSVGMILFINNTGGAWSYGSRIYDPGNVTIWEIVGGIINSVSGASC
jgi:hypothetical protein